MSRAVKTIAIISAVIIILIAALFFYLYFSYRPHKEYGGEIKKWAEVYGVEEALVYAVIKTESNFESSAESGAGARGLMQIMPETGEWIAGKLYKQNHNDDKLFDAAYNIEFGTWYLSYLLNKFENTDTALVAYNAGEGNAKKWLEENIEPPFKETRDYVKRVNRHLKFYRKFL